MLAFLSKFKNNMALFSKFVNTHSEIIKIFSLICAGTFVLIEYIDHQKSKKENHSLEYVYRAHSPELLEARIETEIIPIDPPLDEYTENPWKDQDCSSFSDPVFCPPNNLVLDAQNTYILDNENKQFRRQAHRIAAFYGALAMCALSDKCDVEILCIAFSGEGYKFYMRNYGYLNNLQNNWQIPRAYYINEFIKVCEANKFRLKPGSG